MSESSNASSTIIRKEDKSTVDKQKTKVMIFVEIPLITCFLDKAQLDNIVHMVKNHEDVYRLKNLSPFPVESNMTITEVRKTNIMVKTGIYGLFACRGSTVKQFLFYRGFGKIE